MFPTIKKSITKFVISEKGEISKPSLIKLGLFTFLAGIIQAKYVTAGTHDNATYTTVHADSSCYLTGSPDHQDGTDDYQKKIFKKCDSSEGDAIYTCLEKIDGDFKVLPPGDNCHYKSTSHDEGWNQHGNADENLECTTYCHNNTIKINVEDNNAKGMHNHSLTTKPINAESHGNEDP